MVLKAVRPWGWGRGAPGNCGGGGGGGGTLPRPEPILNEIDRTCRKQKIPSLESAKGKNKIGRKDAISFNIYSVIITSQSCDQHRLF